MRGKALIAAACWLAAVPAAGASEDLGEAEGFRAESVTYREGQAPAGSMTVYMAPEGRRLEGIPPRGITLVSPAGHDKRWLLDPDAGSYAVDPSRAKGGTLGGVLAHEPCKGFAHSQRLGSETISGRRTVKWECRHPSFGKVTQWFDPGINTVIRDRTAKGKIQELRGIEVGDQDPALFRFEPSEEDTRVPVMTLFQPPAGD